MLDGEMKRESEGMENSDGREERRRRGHVPQCTGLLGSYVSDLTLFLFLSSFHHHFAL